MGPVCNNYGTFVVPPGCSEVQIWRDEWDGDPAGWDSRNNYQRNVAAGPPLETKTADKPVVVDCRLRRKKGGSFGVRLGSDRGQAVFLSGVDDDVAQVRGLCEGDIVTHIDGRPLLGSLPTAVSCFHEAKNTIKLRIRRFAEVDTGSTSPSKSKRSKKVKKYIVVQHLVRQGDSLENLAAEHGTTPEQIRADNRRHFPLGEAGFLCPGQTLMLRAVLTPISDSVPRCTADDSSRAMFEATNRSERISRRCGTEGPGERRNQVLYEVQEGDSLEGICARLGAKEAEVRRCNRRVFPVGEPGRLVPGQRLTVFAEGNGGEDWGLREREGATSKTSMSAEREAQYTLRCATRGDVSRG